MNELEQPAEEIRVAWGPIYNVTGMINYAHIKQIFRAKKYKLNLKLYTTDALFNFSRSKKPKMIYDLKTSLVYRINSLLRPLVN